MVARQENKKSINQREETIVSRYKPMLYYPQKRIADK
jgi:hypothetical protein